MSRRPFHSLNDQYSVGSDFSPKRFLQPGESVSSLYLREKISTARPGSSNNEHQDYPDNERMYPLPNDLCEFNSHLSFSERCNNESVHSQLNYNYSVQSYDQFAQHLYHNPHTQSKQTQKRNTFLHHIDLDNDVLNDQKESPTFETNYIMLDDMEDDSSQFLKFYDYSRNNDVFEFNKYYDTLFNDTDDIKDLQKNELTNERIENNQNNDVLIGPPFCSVRPCRHQFNMPNTPHLQYNSSSSSHHQQLYLKDIIKSRFEGLKKKESVKGVMSLPFFLQGLPLRPIFDKYPSAFRPISPFLLTVSTDGLTISYRKTASPQTEYGTAVSDVCIPTCALAYYFEAEILHMIDSPDISSTNHSSPIITIGLSTPKPGSETKSEGDYDFIGYRSDDGHKIGLNISRSESFGPTYSFGDTVGCCVNFYRRCILFTKNGTVIGHPIPLPVESNSTCPNRRHVMKSMNQTILYPMISIGSPGEKVIMHLGCPTCVTLINGSLGLQLLQSDRSQDIHMIFNNTHLNKKHSADLNTQDQVLLGPEESNSNSSTHTCCDLNSSTNCIHPEKDIISDEFELFKSTSCVCLYFGLSPDWIKKNGSPPKPFKYNYETLIETDMNSHRKTILSISLLPERPLHDNNNNMTNENKKKEQSTSSPPPPPVLPPIASSTMSLQMSSIGTSMTHSHTSQPIMLTTGVVTPPITSSAIVPIASSATRPILPSYRNYSDSHFLWGADVAPSPPTNYPTGSSTSLGQPSESFESRVPQTIQSTCEEIESSALPSSVFTSEDDTLRTGRGLQFSLSLQQQLSPIRTIPNVFLQYDHIQGFHTNVSQSSLSQSNMSQSSQRLTPVSITTTTEIPDETRLTIRVPNELAVPEQPIMTDISQAIIMEPSEDSNTITEQEIPTQGTSLTVGNILPIIEQGTTLESPISQIHGSSPSSGPSIKIDQEIPKKTLCTTRSITMDDYASNGLTNMSVIIQLYLLHSGYLKTLKALNIAERHREDSVLLSHTTDHTNTTLENTPQTSKSSISYSDSQKMLDVYNKSSPDVVTRAHDILMKPVQDIPLSTDNVTPDSHDILQSTDVCSKDFMYDYKQFFQHVPINSLKIILQDIQWDSDVCEYSLHTSGPVVDSSSDINRTMLRTRILSFMIKKWKQFLPYLNTQEHIGTSESMGHSNKIIFSPESSSGALSPHGNIQPTLEDKDIEMRVHQHKDKQHRFFEKKQIKQNSFKEKKKLIELTDVKLKTQVKKTNYIIREKNSLFLWRNDRRFLYKPIEINNVLHTSQPTTHVYRQEFLDSYFFWGLKSSIVSGDQQPIKPHSKLINESHHVVPGSRKQSPVFEQTNFLLNKTIPINQDEHMIQHHSFMEASVLSESYMSDVIPQLTLSGLFLMNLMPDVNHVPIVEQTDQLIASSSLYPCIGANQYQHTISSSIIPELLECCICDTSYKTRIKLLSQGSNDHTNELAYIRLKMSSLINERSFITLYNIVNLRTDLRYLIMNGYILSVLDIFRFFIPSSFIDYPLSQALTLLLTQQLIEFLRSSRFTLVLTDKDTGVSSTLKTIALKVQKERHTEIKQLATMTFPSDTQQSHINLNEKLSGQYVSRNRQMINNFPSQSVSHLTNHRMESFQTLCHQSDNQDNLHKSSSKTLRLKDKLALWWMQHVLQPLTPQLDSFSQKIVVGACELIGNPTVKIQQTLFSQCRRRDTAEAIDKYLLEKHFGVGSETTLSLLMKQLVATRGILRQESYNEGPLITSRSIVLFGKRLSLASITTAQKYQIFKKNFPVLYHHPFIQWPIIPAIEFNTSQLYSIYLTSPFHTPCETNHHQLKNNNHDESERHQLSNNGCSCSSQESD